MIRTLLFTFSILGLVSFSASKYDVSPIDPNSRLSEVLKLLGDVGNPYHVETIDEAKAKMGEDLVLKGFTLRDGKETAKISDYFVCTDCHNTVKEADLASDNDPDSRLAYAMKNDIPYLPGSTFWGMSNRTSWFNDDHVKKYGAAVEEANKDYKKSIQLCSKECSSGRFLEDWEMEAMLHYCATLELKISDLNLSEAEGEQLSAAMEAGKPDPETVKMLQTKYLLKYPATFVDEIPVEKRGLGKTGDAEKGKFIFEKSCLHCHKKGRVTKTVFGNEKKQKDMDWLLSYFEKSNGGSIYWINRHGTSPKKKTPQYMPIYTAEKLTDAQMEDLAAYILKKAGS